MNQVIPVTLSRVIIAILLTISSFSSVYAEKVEKQSIGIIVFDGVLTSDITAPAEIFGAATGKEWFSTHKVVLIGVNKKNVVTAEGLKITADAVIKDNLKLDVMIVPSAYNMDPLLANKDLVKYISDQERHASYIASNCSGAFLLAEAGLLDGKKATTWAGGEGDLQKKYRKVLVVKDTNVVVDGKFITSNGSVVSYEAALKLLSKMTSPKHAKEIEDVIQFSRVSSKKLY